MQEQEEIDLAAEEKGWLGKIKDGIYENWQTILVALIVLIVGISAYNYNSKTNSTPSAATTESEQKTEEPSTDTVAEQTDPEGTAEAKDQAAAAATDQANAAKDDQTATQPDATAQTNTETKTTTTTPVVVEGENFKVTAVKGEGLTHLARKALNQYLAENKDDQITNLHRIYVEDYLRKQIAGAGRNGIAIGHEETFAKSVIADAIASSKKLSEQSLNNLKKYEAAR